MNMRLSKYLTILILITIVSLVYTHQQFLLIKANYSIRECESRLSHSLDRHKKLMYNVSTLESPATLEVRLRDEGIKYGIPKQWAVVKGERVPGVGLDTVAERRSMVLERILSFIAGKSEDQALAKNPSSM